MRSPERIEDVPPDEIARLLLGSVKDYAIYLIDPGGHVVSWNAGAERMKGYAESEIVGQHFSVFYSPEDRAAGEPERELLGATEGRYEAEGWRVRKDGTRFWANVIVTAVLRNSALVGFAKITRDLTERRNAEEVRLRMARAETALRLRDEFVGEAKRALDATLVTVRVHLQALRGTTELQRGEAAASIAAKLTMLDWGLDRLTASLERVVKISAETSDKLLQELERSH